MRTTLDIDDDILQAVKELAVLRGATAGQTLSALARQALARPQAAGTRNGVPVLPSRGPGAVRMTMRRVNELRDEP